MLNGDTNRAVTYFFNKLCLIYTSERTVRLKFRYMWTYIKGLSFH